MHNFKRSGVVTVKDSNCGGAAVAGKRRWEITVYADDFSTEGMIFPAERLALVPTPKALKGTVYDTCEMLAMRTAATVGTEARKYNATVDRIQVTIHNGNGGAATVNLEDYQMDSAMRTVTTVERQATEDGKVPAIPKRGARC